MARKLSQAALQRFEAAADIKPEDGAIQLNPGSCLALMNRWEKVEVHVRRGLELVPDHPPARQVHNLLGAILLQLERPEEAEFELRPALDEGVTPPLGAGCRMHLGNVLAQQDRTEEALAEFRRGVESSLSTNVQGRRQLLALVAETLLILERYDEVLELGREAFEEDWGDYPAGTGLLPEFLQNQPYRKRSAPDLPNEKLDCVPARQAYSHSDSLGSRSRLCVHQS